VFFLPWSRGEAFVLSSKREQNSLLMLKIHLELAKLQRFLLVVLFLSLTTLGFAQIETLGNSHANQVFEKGDGSFLEHSSFEQLHDENHKRKDLEVASAVKLQDEVLHSEAVKADTKQEESKPQIGAGKLVGFLLAVSLLINFLLFWKVRAKEQRFRKYVVGNS